VLIVAIGTLTGCASTLTESETREITPALVRYPGPNPGFLNIDPQWIFVNGDRQEVKLTCTDRGIFAGGTLCTDEAGTVAWEPKTTKYDRYGYLTLNGGERTKFRCTQRFEGFEELAPTHFCYQR